MDDRDDDCPHERAHAFQLMFCARPTCGVHILSLRADDTPICETVMSQEQTLAMIEYCKANLYAKVVGEDDDSNDI